MDESLRKVDNDMSTSEKFALRQFFCYNKAINSISILKGENEMVELTLRELPQCSSFWGYPNTRLEEFLKSGARRVFAYKIDDEYVGGCALIIREGQSGHFSDFCVREDLRGKGIGSCILQFAIDCFKENGTKTIRLHVYKDNPAAIRLYERYGFRYFEDMTPEKIAMIKTL